MAMHFFLSSPYALVFHRMHKVLHSLCIVQAIAFIMVRNTGRVGHVQTLRGHARLCGVDSCADEAARQLVTEMMARIRGATGHALLEVGSRLGGQSPSAGEWYKFGFAFVGGIEPQKCT